MDFDFFEFSRTRVSFSGNNSESPIVEIPRTVRIHYDDLNNKNELNQSDFN
jgi:hypothetical protein